MTCRILLVALFGLMCRGHAQLANQPPVPQWLKGSVVERHFAHQGKLLKAILLVAGDGEVEVKLNGQPAGHALPGENATSMDVTRFVREGDNVLRLDTKGSRVAALLELNGDVARKTWLITDTSWKSAGGDAVTAAPIDAQANPFDFRKTFDAYNSWQLARPGAQNMATDPGTFTLPAGFKAELVHSASTEEGSWVAMTFDPQGRITLAREKRGLLRFDPKTKRTEVIEDTLLECRGLLYADGVLFANANNSKGLYRLSDADGDGRFEEAREILHTEGGVGHGRNHLKMGPDGWLYVAHGNNVLLPANVSPQSPLKNYAGDQLIPNPWDGSMFDGNVELPAGHVLRVKPDGSEVQLVAGGFRNPLDLAFNKDGELFTFDADMERDVGTHWYMPNRVLHVVPGADFGWRRGTGRYPAWYADTLPSVVDIGLASPTAVFFGYGAKFPARYRDALFCCDWAYGRIIAVTMRPKGASYSGTQETFVSGRPMNVTDGCIGPDGALWFTTGGRGTQSGLYRIEYVGAGSDVAIDVPHPKRSATKPAPGSEDAFARHAKRMEMEDHVEDLKVEQVTELAWGWEALFRWLIAVRSGRSELRDAAIGMTLRMPWDDSPVEQQLAALRILGIGIARAGGSSVPWRDDALAAFDARFPAKDQRLNWELGKLLVQFRSPTIIAKATDHLKAATASEDLLFYPMYLRHLKEGWTLEQRRIAFDALNRAEKMNGASTYFKAIADTRSELAAALSPEEAGQLAAVIHPVKPVPLLATALPGHTFRNWKMADLEPRLAEVGRGRSFANAKAALVSTQCVFCHRVSADATLPAGVFGPDLSQVSSRFNRRDLLLHILEPSAVIDEKFRNTLLTLVDGRQIIGSLEREDDERVVLRPNPLSPEVVEVGKAQIRERTISTTSPMPPGLLNALKAEQIFDMLAYFEAGGNPKHPSFR
jgi:putative heme-binding domain-containing protein